MFLLLIENNFVYQYADILFNTLVGSIFNDYFSLSQEFFESPCRQSFMPNSHWSHSNYTNQWLREWHPIYQYTIALDTENLSHKISPQILATSSPQTQGIVITGTTKLHVHYSCIVWLKNQQIYIDRGVTRICITKDHRLKYIGLFGVSDRLYKLTPFIINIWFYVIALFYKQ